MKRRYGLPFEGYTSTTPRHMATNGMVTKDSRDWLLDPNDGKWYGRSGSKAISSVSSTTAMTSMLEPSISYQGYGRQIVEMSSPQLTSPTVACLLSNETMGLISFLSPNTIVVASCSMAANSNTITCPTANAFMDIPLGAGVSLSGLGTRARVLTNSSTWGGAQTMTLSEAPTSAVVALTATFGGTVHPLWRAIGMHDNNTNSTHYPSNFKCVPVIGKSNRLKTAAERALVALGSRRIINTKHSLFMGNGVSGHIPLRWNKDWNDNRASGSRNCRLFPMGNIPPLFMYVADGSAGIPVGQSPAWKDGDVMFWSVMYRYKDGSFSKPFVPREKLTAAPNFYGMHQVSGNRSTLTVTIPIGPDDVDARYLLRTRKGNITAPPPLADENGNSLLAICAVIENNTQTSYTDPNGNDGNLLYDPTIVRFDSIWPQPTRYLWTGDHRIWGGYLFPQTAAIVIAPQLYQVTDESVGTTYSVANDGTNLSLNSENPGVNTTTIALSGLSLQQLVDAINETIATASNGGSWCAQLAPGADPGALATDLAVTTSIDFGDSATARLRCFSTAWPGVLSMSSSYLSGLPSQPGSFWMGIGGPQTKPFSPSTTVKNVFKTDEGWGYFVGGAPLTDGQVVCFSKRIGIVRNRKDGASGLDEDYRLDVLNANRGCISDATIVSGDGWVGYATQDGFVVTDGVREVVISGALFNPAALQGEMGIMESAMGSAITFLNTPDGLLANGYIAAGISGSRLFLSWSGSPGGLSIYDFSAGTPGSGLAEILAPDGRPWGWSCPCYFDDLAHGVVGRVDHKTYLIHAGGSPSYPVLRQILTSDTADLDAERSSGNGDTFVSGQNTFGISGSIASRVAVGSRVITPGNFVTLGTTVLSMVGGIVTMSRNAIATGSGQVYCPDRRVAADLWCAADFCNDDSVPFSGLKLKKPQECYALYAKPWGTGMTLSVYTDKDRAIFSSMTMPLTGNGDIYQRKRFPFPQKSRSPAELIELRVQDDGSGIQPRFWGAEVEVKLLESRR